MNVKKAFLACAIATACATAPRQQAVPVDVPIAPPPRPLAELFAQLKAPDAPSRAAAAWALAGAGTVDEAGIESLLAALDDPSEPVREAAAWTLGHVKGPGFDHSKLNDVPPKPLVMTRPNYPNAAFREKVQGVVLVAILINALGRVTHAEIRRSIPGLDEAALACVRDWRFEPGRRRGQPVPVAAQAPVGFRIF
jgi:TonB family protein